MKLVGTRGERVPLAAVVLGGAGTLPLIIATPVAFWVPQLFDISVLHVAVTYAAVILSFLGGMHWGLASAALARDDHALDAAHVLAFSVVPSLIGWIALLLPGRMGSIVLAFSFMTMLLLDRFMMQLDYAPRWWMRLRVSLTAVVVPLLLLLAFAPRQR